MVCSATHRCHYGQKEYQANKRFHGVSSRNQSRGSEMLPAKHRCFQSSGTHDMFSRQKGSYWMRRI